MMRAVKIAKPEPDFEVGRERSEERYTPKEQEIVDKYEKLGWSFHFDFLYNNHTGGDDGYNVEFNSPVMRHDWMTITDSNRKEFSEATLLACEKRAVRDRLRELKDWDLTHWFEKIMESFMHENPTMTCAELEKLKIEDFVDCFYGIKNYRKKV